MHIFTQVTCKQLITIYWLLNTFCLSSQSTYFTSVPSNDGSFGRNNHINLNNPLQSIYKPLIANPPEIPDESKLMNRLYNDHELTEYQYYDKYDYHHYPLRRITSSSFKSMWPALILLSSVPSSIISLLTVPILIALLMHMLKQIIITQNTINQSIASQSGLGPPEPMNRINQISSDVNKAVQKFSKS